MAEDVLIQHNGKLGKPNNLFGKYELEKKDRFGRSSTSIGDLDGDGVPDLAFCASRDSDGNHFAGAIFIALMNRDGSVKDAKKISNNYGNLCDENVNCLQEEDLFGYALTNVGDIDGDGVTDIATTTIGNPCVFILFLNKDGTLKNHIRNLLRGSPY